MDKHMRDALIAAIMTTLIVLRVILEEPNWMGAITLFALGVVFFDLYMKIKDRYENFEKFRRFNCISLVFGIVFVILLTLVTVGIIILDDIALDVITLISLTLSLVPDTICAIAGWYIKMYWRKY